MYVYILLPTYDIIFASAAKECDINNGGCDHYCTDTIDGYFCSCYTGYTLLSDQHTCIGE